MNKNLGVLDSRDPSRRQSSTNVKEGYSLIAYDRDTYIGNKS